jgi:hypothetical protein
MRALLVTCGAAVLLTACEQIPGLQRGGAVDHDGAQLALALEVPDALDWGEMASIRMTVANEGGAASRDVRIELFLPPWLEFSAVDPVGTEVALLASGEETRLAYGIGDPPLAPGETRAIVQRVRVPPRSTAFGPARDTVIEPSLVPQNRTLRARLVTADGRALGSELRTTLPFRGVGPATPTAPATPPAGAATPPRDTLVPPPQQTQPQVPPPQPQPRDTTPGAG